MLPAPAAAFAQAVGTWYDEIHKYDYNAPGAGGTYPTPYAAPPVLAPCSVRDHRCILTGCKQSRWADR